MPKELEWADAEHRIKEAEAPTAELKEQYAKDQAAWEEQNAGEAKRAMDGHEHEMSGRQVDLGRSVSL